MRRHLAVFLALAAGLLVAGCGKKGSADPEGYQEIGSSFDDSDTPPAERKPVEGADLGGLSDAEKNRFERLVDTLPSPCGAAHSLRSSRNDDESCRRASFAVDYVIALLGDGFTNREIGELYELRYPKEVKKQGFMLDDIPHEGPADAEVVLVEFYDYGCPACRTFKEVLDQARAAFPRDVVLYYKQFPLGSHEHSLTAAQAALAAASQGKFRAMHDRLFASPHEHGKEEDYAAHARAAGLDVDQFEEDFQAAAARVQADKREGTAAGVTGTPTLFINGRRYQGIDHPKYLKMWIREALATGP